MSWPLPVECSISFLFNSESVLLTNHKNKLLHCHGFKQQPNTRNLQIYITLVMSWLRLLQNALHHQQFNFSGWHFIWKQNCCKQIQWRWGHTARSWVILVTINIWTKKEYHVKTEAETIVTQPPVRVLGATRNRKWQGRMSSQSLLRQHSPANILISEF